MEIGIGREYFCLEVCTGLIRRIVMDKDYGKQEAAFAELLEIMETLRSQCPWDKKQTMESLRNLTVEEVYELGDAILRGDMEEVKKELGDILMHVVFYALIGQEKGAFDITDVLEEICEKLRYRHPHIYGEAVARDAGEVERNWERLKLKEKGRSHRVLEGVPATLPAMVKACRVQEKVSGVGFDWEKREDVWAKVKEEVGELEEEMRRGDARKMEEEFGDVFFALVNAARLYGVNPEDALERTNRKFMRRFSHVEDRAEEQGRALTEMGLEEMERYWEEAKAKEN